MKHSSRFYSELAANRSIDGKVIKHVFFIYCLYRYRQGEGLDRALDKLFSSCLRETERDKNMHVCSAPTGTNYRHRMSVNSQHQESVNFALFKTITQLIELFDIDMNRKYLYGASKWDETRELKALFELLKDKHQRIKDYMDQNGFERDFWKLVRNYKRNEL